MADIELVIKINENIWKRICDSQSVPDMLNIDIVNGLNAIKNGTPLPKGHGKLFDADMIESHDEYDGQGFTKSVYKDDIDSLPPIIEADVEGSIIKEEIK